MLNMSQLPTQEDNNQDPLGNGTTSVLMKELMSPETQLSIGTLQSCKRPESSGTLKTELHMYTEQLDLVIAKVLAKRNHLAPGSEQTSNSSSTRRGSLDTPATQSCPAQAWARVCPCPWALCRSRAGPSPTHPRSCRRCCSARRGAAGRSYTCSST